MEKTFKIPTRDRKYIHGVINYPSSKVKHIIVIVHGFAGNKEEHPYFTGARYFLRNGFAVCRFDLYTWEKKGRKLDETTIAINAEDTDTIVSYLRKKGYEKVFVVGHSLSGLSTLRADTKYIDGLILWDPSNDNMLRKKPFWIKYDKKIREYIAQASMRFFMGRMYQSWQTFPEIIPVIKTIKKPLLIIAAGRGILKYRCKEYYQATNAPKKFVIIKKAGHMFSEEGVEDQLFKETLQWCKKFSK